MVHAGQPTQARSGCVMSGPEDRDSTRSGVGSRLGCRNLGDCPIGDALAIVGAGNSHIRGRVSPQDDVGKTRLGDNSRTDSRQDKECRRTRLKPDSGGGR